MAIPETDLPLENLSNDEASPDTSIILQAIEFSGGLELKYINEYFEENAPK